MVVTSVQQQMQQSFQTHVDENLLLDCMRCGFCLSSCPTYLHMEQDEAQSPRGRIALMKAVRDGLVPFDASIEHSFDLCLGCRACEPACPAGVQYGALIEQTREAVQEVKRSSFVEKTTRNIVFDRLFVEQKNMERAVSLLHLYQKTGLQKVVRKIGFLNLFPKHLKTMEASLPAVAKKVQPLKQAKSATMKVAFFTGCLMDTLYRETNDKTVSLLRMLGVEVVIPDQQSCCGALHGHSGELKRGKQNLIHNVELFDSDDYTYIVNNAGGCGAFLKEYEKHLSSDKRYHEKAIRFSEKTIDISSLLVKAGLLEYLATLPQQVKKTVVTYQDSCHLRNVNKVFNEPRMILQALPNVQFKELPSANTCCGSAGIYNLLQPALAGEILTTKMTTIKALEPAVVVTANPGCLLQIQAGIHKEQLGSSIQAAHIVDFLYNSIANYSKIS
ncbi:(Fe-S)-binding protein [Lysinibacillus sp. FSL K6-0232]|uniref:(Fe-S)-binding protein n=1 Tax=unclassified Lysinibacillus TaxID=2636778 RepID=UPI0030FC4FD1